MEGKAFLKKKKKSFIHMLSYMCSVDNRTKQELKKTWNEIGKNIANFHSPINFQVSGFFNQTAKMIFNYVMKDIMDWIDITFYSMQYVSKIHTLYLICILKCPWAKMLWKQKCVVNNGCNWQHLIFHGNVLIYDLFPYSLVSW